jgi:hypothetical protein
MKEFVFEQKQKSYLIGGMVIGLISMALTFFNDDVLHTRFWSNFLHNSVFFTGIAFLSLFLLCAKILAYAGWHVSFKRVWEANAQFLLVGLILMLIIAGGAWFHYHHLYHWADRAEVAKDKVLSGKAGFLSPFFYTFATVLFLGIYYWFARKMRALSLKEENESGDSNFTTHRTMRFFAAIFLPFSAFTSAALIWLWLMSLDAHWYSTMFAWYTTASWLVSTVSFTILLLMYLQSKGYYSWVTVEHFHDLGKFTFGFSVFWTYLWFSQYMLIWYANNGEETIYFNLRMREYPALFYGNLVVNFVLPFLILIRNDTKRKRGTLIFVASLVLFGHWVDFFQMVKPSARVGAAQAIHHMGGEHHEKAISHTEAGGHAKAVSHSENDGHTAPKNGDVSHDGHGAASHEVHEKHPGHPVGNSYKVGYTLPGFLEIGTLIGFASLFLYVILGKLAQAPLAPKNDPYIQESLNHHVM